MSIMDVFQQDIDQVGQVYHLMRNAQASSAFPRRDFGIPDYREHRKEDTVRYKHYSEI